MADWRKELGSFLDSTDNSGAEEKGSELGSFIADTVLPAFEEIRAELVSRGREVNVRDSEMSAVIVVNYQGEEELSYRVQGRTFPDRQLPFAKVRFRERKGLRRISVESMFRSGQPDYTMEDIGQDEVIRNFLDHYMRRVKPE
jgi:hypothetical protein